MVHHPGALPLEHGRQELEAALLRVEAYRRELPQVHPEDVLGRQRGRHARPRAAAVVVGVLLLRLLRLLAHPAGAEGGDGLGDLQVQAEELALPDAAPLPEALHD